MTRLLAWASVAVMMLGCAPFVLAQQSQASVTVTVPRLMKHSGAVTDSKGKALTGVVGMNFYLYKQQQGGGTLWMETQNVRLDSAGHYNVMLGASKGLPAELFTSGEARWLGVQAHGQAEQARVLLLSVPYALKAADAETIGGLPASAFVLVAPAGTAASSTSATGNTAINPALTGTGAINTVPLWTTTTNLGNSSITENTTTKAITVGGALNLPATGTATSTAGKNSQGEKFTASSFSSTFTIPEAQNFEWLAEPTGNNTGSPSGKFNLLFSQGVAAPAEIGTGVSISSAGKISAPSFAGNGTGLTSVNASKLGGLGSGAFAKLGTSNSFTGNETVSGNVSAANLHATSAVSGATGSFTGDLNVGGIANVTGVDTSDLHVDGSINGSDITLNAFLTTAASFTDDSGGNHDTVSIEDTTTSVGTSSLIFADDPKTGGGNMNLDTGGNLSITGFFSKGGGSFKIDHPLDPANKYLYHSFVESPDMKNIYDGIAVLDTRGEGVVELPKWFEALNRDFRYQLTAIGVPGPNLYIAEEISGNRFKIAGGQPGMKVSWQLTGIRQDALANAHRIPVEENKAGAEAGHYLHAELFGQPKEKSITWVHRQGQLQLQRGTKPLGNRTMSRHPVVTDSSTRLNLKPAIATTSTK